MGRTTQIAGTDGGRPPVVALDSFIGRERELTALPDGRHPVTVSGTAGVGWKATTAAEAAPNIYPHLYNDPGLEY